MADFVFKISPNVILGPYTMTRIGQVAATWGSNYMLIADPILKEFGLVEKAVSALEEKGLVEVWDTIKNHKKIMTASGELEKKRQDQAMSWMWFLVNEGLERWFYQHPEIQKLLPSIKQGVEDGKVAPTRAADELVSMLGKDLLL